MLAHKLLAQSTTNFKSNYSVALVETESDYVVAKWYDAASGYWGSGCYFPKVESDALNDAIVQYEHEVLYAIEHAL